MAIGQFLIHPLADWMVAPGIRGVVFVGVVGGFVVGAVVGCFGTTTGVGTEGTVGLGSVGGFDVGGAGVGGGAGGCDVGGAGTGGWVVGTGTGAGAGTWTGAGAGARAAGATRGGAVLAVGTEIRAEAGADAVARTGTIATSGTRAIGAVGAATAADGVGSADRNGWGTGDGGRADGDAWEIAIGGNTPLSTSNVDSLDDGQDQKLQAATPTTARLTLGNNTDRRMSDLLLAVSSIGVLSQPDEA